jgi:hypothetical protein
VNEKLSRLEEILPLVSVAHHIPGRVRLKLKGKIPPQMLASPINERFGAIKGITGISVNLISASAVVTYDREALPPSLFEALRNGDYTQILECARSVL